MVWAFFIKLPLADNEHVLAFSTGALVYWTGMRCLLHARPSRVATVTVECDRHLDTVSCGALSLWHGLAYGERLVVLLFLGGQALFLCLGVAEYTTAGKPFVYIFGYSSACAFSLALVPVAKRSFVLRALGISFERAIKWHRLFARCVACKLQMSNCQFQIYAHVKKV